MEELAQIDNISEAIQLAVAPVFLLTGIGAILSVLAHRLARIVDRARLVERRMQHVTSEENGAIVRSERRLLWRRIALINWAIRLLVGSALVVCVVVMSLFLGDFAMVNMSTVIAVLFVIAMVLLILALLFLLFEVSISTRKMLRGVEHLFAEKD